MSDPVQPAFPPGDPRWPHNEPEDHPEWTLRDRALHRLLALGSRPHDPEVAHTEDDEISAAFERIDKWYA